MPVVHIYLLEGRNEERLKELIESVTSAISKSLEIDPDRITIILHEVSPSRFAKGGVTLKEEANM